MGVCLLGALALVARLLLNTDPKVLAKIVRYGGFGICASVALFFLLTGRFALGLPLAFAAAAMLRRWALPKLGPRMSGGIGGGGPSGGRSSDVETEYLRMSLDHDSGAMAGEVLIGDYAGQRIEEMELSDLIDLTAECVAQDEQSAQILEAYLDRTYPDWREQVEAEAQGKSGGENRHEHGRGWGPKAQQDGMSQNEAYEVLGLSPGATEKEIKEAYHRLISNLHPDHGGSTYLAAKINQAKDTLLQHI